MFSPDDYHGNSAVWFLHLRPVLLLSLWFCRIRDLAIQIFKHISKNAKFCGCPYYFLISGCLCVAVESCVEYFKQIQNTSLQ